jgi:hypothetical protein
MEEEDIDPRKECHYCGGEGGGFVEDFGLDPLLYGFREYVNCPCCKGSGLAKDETFW